MAEAPLISVIIAAYRPGEGFDRVIRSLDAQTLPQDRFETIVVDDGSPDDTYERLQRLASTRPNMRVERIENSGWPSRPRNVATGLARGDYVFYMDHDDSLYPHALQRMAEYAAETRADVLSPKESKTSDPWWGMSSLADGDIPNAVTDGGIARLLPMVPHKLYRREFLDDHGIRFPEGRRQLWEDIYVNVEAWRHAQRVAVLADTPAYLWWSSRTNNSKTYGPRSEEFWDRLDELFAFVDETLDGPEHAAARKASLLHQYQTRVLIRLSRNLRPATPEETTMAMARARAIQQRYIPEEWDAELGKQPRARAVLLRQDRPDLLIDLWSADANTAASITARSVGWEQGKLRLEIESRWTDREGRRVALRRRVDGTVQRNLPPRLLAALPADVVDFTDTLPAFRLVLGIRDRIERVTWQLQPTGQASWQQFEDGRVAPRLVSRVLIDPETAAMGRPLASSVHDVVGRLYWGDADRTRDVVYEDRAMPAVTGGRPAVAYRTTKGALAVDLDARLRNPVADGGPAAARIPGTLHGLSLPLPRVATDSSARIPAAIRLVPDNGDPGDEYTLPGSLHAERTGARLEVAAQDAVPDGTYELTFSVGESGAYLGRRVARVHGDTLTIVRNAASAAASPLVVWPARFKRLEKRGRVMARDVLRKIQQR